jgi:hypothetical protein
LGTLKMESGTPEIIARMHTRQKDFWGIQSRSPCLKFAPAPEATWESPRYSIYLSG